MPNDKKMELFEYCFEWIKEGDKPPKEEGWEKMEEILKNQEKDSLKIVEKEKDLLLSIIEFKVEKSSWKSKEPKLTEKNLIIDEIFEKGINFMKKKSPKDDIIPIYFLYVFRHLFWEFEELEQKTYKKTFVLKVKSSLYFNKKKWDEKVKEIDINESFLEVKKTNIFLRNIKSILLSLKLESSLL